MHVQFYQSNHTDETLYYEVDPWTRRKVYIMKWTLDQAESLYYEVDPGPVGKFILWRGPWTRRKVYIMKWTLDHPTTLFPLIWSRFSEFPQPYTNSAFQINSSDRGLRNTAADSKCIPYLIFILSQAHQESHSLAFLSRLWPEENFLVYFCVRVFKLRSCHLRLTLGRTLLCKHIIGT